eukprot:SAG11_NODE_7743_length_1101_cov_3.237525_1_plen_57_part_10
MLHTAPLHLLGCWGLTSSIRGSKITSSLLLFYILNFLPNLRPVLEPAQNFRFVGTKF